MVAACGKYFLICNHNKFDNISHYRINRISNIELFDTPRKPKNEVEGLMGLDIAQYMNEHIYMSGCKSFRTQFEMPKYLVSDVLDHFKADVNFKELDAKCLQA